MNMHFTLHTHETGPPGHKTSTEVVNITLLGNMAILGSLTSLCKLQLLAEMGNEAAKQELKSISHLVPHALPKGQPKDKNNAKRSK